MELCSFSRLFGVCMFSETHSCSRPCTNFPIHFLTNSLKVIFFSNSDMLVFFFLRKEVWSLLSEFRFERTKSEFSSSCSSSSFWAYWAFFRNFSTISLLFSSSLEFDWGDSGSESESELELSSEDSVLEFYS